MSLQMQRCNNLSLTEKEMLIAKIGVLSGCVATGKATPEKATEVLKFNASVHGFSFEDALKLEQEIDQMLGDSTLI